MLRASKLSVLVVFTGVALTGAFPAPLARAQPLPPEKAKAALLKQLDRPRVEPAVRADEKPTEKGQLVYSKWSFASEKKAIVEDRVRVRTHMMESAGRVLTRGQLLDGVWGRDSFVDERTVDVHIGRLRKALIRGREKDPIRTVRGSGYGFDETFGK